MNIDQMKNATFEEIKRCFGWKNKFLSNCFSATWSTSKRNLLATQKRMRATEILFKIIAPWAYKLGYDQCQKDIHSRNQKIIERFNKEVAELEKEFENEKRKNAL